MDKDGSLYVFDWKQNEVRRWRKGEINGTIVAGGNGEGNQLNQFHYPTFIFVDDDHALYVSDTGNHRVMKWLKDAKEGIVVAGGNGEGDSVIQVRHPNGVIVDQFGQIGIPKDAHDETCARACGCGCKVRMRVRM
jgi:sugar lactone lactonase YvrE